MARVRRVGAGLCFVLIPVWAQTPPAAPQSGVVSAGTGNPYQRAGQLAARIMDFTAEPASIQPGQKVTLTWSTENPSGVTIDPDPGRVTPRGAMQLSPARTTTYTLTVRGPNNQVLTRALTVNVVGTTPAPENAAASAAAKREVPLTAAGRPIFRESMISAGEAEGVDAEAAEATRQPRQPVLS